MRSEAVITDLPLEGRVDRISVFLLGCLEIASGATPDLG
jgi:predicted naringenin-chalcone synthase